MTTRRYEKPRLTATENFSPLETGGEIVCPLAGEVESGQYSALRHADIHLAPPDSLLSHSTRPHHWPPRKSPARSSARWRARDAKAALGLSDSRASCRPNAVCERSKHVRGGLAAGGMADRLGSGVSGGWSLTGIAEQGGGGVFFEREVFGGWRSSGRRGRPAGGISNWRGRIAGRADGGRWRFCGAGCGAGPWR